MIQEEPGRPCIDVSAVKDITVKAGEEFTIRVPFTGGNPKPVASFENAGREVFDEDDGRVKIEVADGVATMTVKPSKRSDAGPYKVTLKNRFGGDSCKLNVNVLDRPGPPQGPLDATDIEADALTLNWRPPKDNGGDEITNYIVEKKAPNGDWQRVTGSVAGTMCRVRNLDEGVPYEFRVMAENQYGISDPLVSFEPITAKSPFCKPSLLSVLI